MGRWKTWTGRAVVNSVFPYSAMGLAGLSMGDENREKGLLPDKFAQGVWEILNGDYDRAFPVRPRAGGTCADGSLGMHP